MDVLQGVSGRVAVKVDCEGCEQYLVDVPCQILRKAREYIVEVHPWVGISEKILKHFEYCGYSADLKISLDSRMDFKVWHFKLKDIA